MKAAEIQVGKTYIAKVSNRLVKVKVDAIRETQKYKGLDRLGGQKFRDTTVYDVTNTLTGRHITFKSAAKFRREVIAANADGRGAS